MKVVTMQQITYNNQEATLIQTRDKIILAKSKVYLTYMMKGKGYQGSDSAYLKIVGWELKVIDKKGETWENVLMELLL